MPKFQLADKERVLLTSIYEIEADTEQEAIDKYVNELAGSASLICIDQYWDYDEDCTDEVVIHNPTIDQLGVKQYFKNTD